MKELIKYLALKSVTDEAFGRTKLNKLLFYCDFLAYRDLGQPITGDGYHKEPYGPVADHLSRTFGNLVKASEIAEAAILFHGHEQKKPVALVEAGLSVFSPSEVALLDYVFDKLQDKNASEVSDLSHTFIGWKTVNMGESIPYEFALHNHREPNDEGYKWANSIAATL